MPSTFSRELRDIRSIIGRHVALKAVEEITEDTLLSTIVNEVLDPDSPDSEAVLMAIENEFGIQIPPDVAYGAKSTVGDLVLITQRLSKS